MIDSDTLIEQITKRRGLGLAMIKRFAEAGTDQLTEHQIVNLATSDLGGGAEFAKRYQGDDQLGRMLRTATMKARDAAWFKPAAPLTGERALATTVQPGTTERKAMRERIVADKRTASPWMSQAELEAYAEAMERELERAGRAKAKPGTMERV